MLALAADDAAQLVLATMILLLKSRGAFRGAGGHQRQVFVAVGTDQGGAGARVCARKRYIKYAEKNEPQGLQALRRERGQAVRIRVLSQLHVLI